MTALFLALFGFGALAAGVLVGRYYVPDDRALRRSARHAQAYLRAMNHVLARDRDAAVEELVAVVADNVGELEPYFALGALFRARGEWERAIRVHQAIELRAGKDQQLRQRARYALGQDFRAAGMPRRATRAMEECLAADAKHVGSLRALCGLYEEQGRYAEAAASWRRLRKLTGEAPTRREHHLLVAAAQRAILAGDLDAAKRLLRDAGRTGEVSAHHLVASAELAAARGDAAKARERLLGALELAPELARTLSDALFVAELELSADDERGDDDAAIRAAAALAELAAAADDEPHLSLAAASLRARVDPEAALAEVRAVALRDPDLLAARVAAGRLALAGGDADEVRAELRALVAADGALGWVDDGRWRCSRCGAGAEALFWRCAGCRQWGTARLDTGAGALAAAPPAPRERRAQPRPTAAALTSASQRALPAPTLDTGEAVAEAGAAARPRATLSRATTWVTSALRGQRRGGGE